MSLNYRQVIAAMGSAVIAALLASAFGAKGTIIGVAIGAGTATVLSAVLTHSLDRAHGAVREVLAGGEDGTEPSEPEDDRVAIAAEAERRRLLSHPYLRLVATGAFVFALALMAVTGLELVIGRPLPTIFGVSEPPGAKTSVGVVLERGPTPKLPDATTTTTSTSTTTTTRGDSTTTSSKRTTTTSKKTTTTASSTTTTTTPDPSSTTSTAPAR